MEDLRPDDIVGYRFKQALRGYAVDEVDRLLDRLADQIERMAAEIADLRGRVEVAETQAAVTRETEATLQRTLVVAQQAAERNLADAAAQAEATLANATAEAERLRREVDEEAARSRAEAEELATGLRADAEADAERTLQRAQELARREVQAARARVEEAAGRHAEVIGRVTEHRDALRRELANLEDLALAVGPEPRAELVAGELPPEPGVRAVSSVSEAEAGTGPEVPNEHDEAAPETVTDDVPTPPSPLTVRVHEERHERPGGGPAPLGSAGRDDG